MEIRQQGYSSRVGLHSNVQDNGFNLKIRSFLNKGGKKNALTVGSCLLWRLLWFECYQWAGVDSISARWRGGDDLARGSGGCFGAIIGRRRGNCLSPDVFVVGVPPFSSFLLFFPGFSSGLGQSVPLKAWPTWKVPETKYS